MSQLTESAAIRSPKKMKLNDFANRSSKISDLALKALMVRNRQDLQLLIQQQVGNVIFFDNMSINIVNDLNQTHAFYAYYSREAKKVDDEFTRLKNATYPVKDGFFNVTLETDFPVIWDLDEVVLWNKVPDCARYCHENHIKTVVGVSMIDRNKRIGNVFLGFHEADSIDELEIKYIQEVVSHIAVAVGNIKEIEENIRLHKEKDLFLLLSNAAAAVKDKQSFGLMMSHVLKKLVEFNGFAVHLMEDDHFVYEPYLVHFEGEYQPLDHTFSSLGNSRIRLNQNSANQLIEADTVRVWSISELMKLNSRPEFITRYRIHNIKNMATLPIFNNREKIGQLFLFAENQVAFAAEELAVLSHSAAPVGAAVYNMRKYEELTRKEKESAILISLIQNLVLVRDRRQFEQVLKKEFSSIDFFDEATILFLKAGYGTYAELLVKSNPDALGRTAFFNDKTTNNEDDALFTRVKQLRNAAEFDVTDLLGMDNAPAYIKAWADNGIKKVAAVPVANGTTLMGVLFLFSGSSCAGFQQHFRLINGMASQISAAASNILANEKIAKQFNEISSYKQQLEIENLYLQEEIQTTHNYSEIVGTSNTMKEVFHLVSQVSITNSSVLILGETGTGKELIARAIHNTSSRKDKVMVKVNCATLPANLIESELFGHERGSFTGATERRIGKFELANNSTIFLDEIGEMPPALQVKLLRALQEKEIERIGGKVTIKTDVRVIAATNRDLFKEVQLGNFRSDLYFRLNVFPVLLPSLKDRKEDIPLLVGHFVEKYAKKFGVTSIHVTSRAMKQLVAYNWPGNVRELEHLIERSVLLARGNTINQVYLPGQTAEDIDRPLPLQNTDVKTIDEIERAHIISVLKMVNGKVSGVGGAAEILKIPATTLSSKILRLKIKKGIS